MGEMLNLSSVIGAAPVVIGAVVMLLVERWTLSVESSTVSISEQSTGTKPYHLDPLSLPEAAKGTLGKPIVRQGRTVDRILSVLLGLMAFMRKDEAREGVQPRPLLRDETLLWKADL